MKRGFPIKTTWAQLQPCWPGCICLSHLTLGSSSPGVTIPSGRPPGTGSPLHLEIPLSYPTFNTQHQSLFFQEAFSDSQGRERPQTLMFIRLCWEGLSQSCLLTRKGAPRGEGWVWISAKIQSSWIKAPTLQELRSAKPGGGGGGQLG